MDYWAKAPLRRDQILLFSPTLDDSISDDHPVRLLDEILRAQDWSAWEQEYDGTRGQPPIPPWVMAGVILYGLMRRIRSSRQVEFYTPVESPSPQQGNPAGREDPRQPVPEADWPKLPRNDKKKLAKCCFVYDEATDTYFCPMGKAMPYRETKKYDGSQGKKAVRIYACKDCSGCPLAAECRDAKAKRGRTVTRDGYEPWRERMHAKLQTEAGKQTYHRRMHVGETPFAVIKGILGVRRFLLRGLEKVRTEWRWVCTACNLKKLIGTLAALRAEDGKTPASPRG